MGLLQPAKQRDIKPISHRTKPFHACRVANFHHMGNSLREYCTYYYYCFIDPHYLFMFGLTEKWSVFGTIPTQLIVFYLK